MNVRLILKYGGRRKVIQLRGPVAVLGRAHGNAVRIPSAEISRRHCRLFLKDGIVTIEDMESVNGTFLNGRRIKSTQTVHPGDEIEIGPVAFTVEYDLTPEARAKLRGKEDSVELLQALADGEALDELPELEILQDDPLGLGGSDEEPTRDKPSRPRTDVLEPIPAEDFDFEATPWKMPDGGDLRDLLEEMEEEPTRARKPKKRGE